MPKDEEEECKQEYVASLSVCESGDNISYIIQMETSNINQM